MAFHPITIASLFVAVLFSSGVLAEGKTAAPWDQDCWWYDNANSTAASCNGVRNRVCAGGCTGYVTATNCTTSHKMDDPKPPLTTEKCTVSYGRSSATMSICVAENRSFICYGRPTGRARCKGCSESGSSGNGNDGKGKGNGENDGSGDKSAPGGSPTDKNAPPQTNSTTGSTSTPPTTTSSPTDGNADPPKQEASPKSSSGASLGWNGFSLAVATFLSSFFFQ
ncbi:hypothetical protein PTTG_08526 [Puccinia triticina 1-1 BBBD Race 1]|uniref:Secreted protein n=2 Tax=Puccinia triticina TaxID=208348 RepID=A0A180H051_PUCT1|nr:uncharacterized protein PtA15_9A496 [Puccinia triticina]OAV98465.1 hypothetical protein PTTG_08526 [Puccinia triticina 1-1 BBBD Race 1]WAQ88369.1 hypothetical protein PtA15_9A496 [Puccinia triticina]